MGLTEAFKFMHSTGNCFGMKFEWLEAIHKCSQNNLKRNHMKKLSLFFILLLLVVAGKSQQVQAQTAGIALAGESRKLVIPDVAILYLNLNADAKTESESLEKLARRQQEILKQLKAEGFTEEQIKLSNFSVNARFDYGKNGEAKRIGFSATQSYVVKFPLDKQRLLKVYKNLSSQNTSADLTISMGNECSEALKEKTELELIKIAVKNAGIRANALAEASGMKVGNVEYIRYHLAEQLHAPVNAEMKWMAPAAVADASGQQFSTDFSIQEIEFSERVEIRYQLLNK